MKSGKWSEEEKERFESACISMGWGRWADIHMAGLIPTRSPAQIKSHAQKFQKNHPGKLKRIFAQMKIAKIANDTAKAETPKVPKKKDTVKTKSKLPAKKRGGALSKKWTTGDHTANAIGKSKSKGRSRRYPMRSRSSVRLQGKMKQEDVARENLTGSHYKVDGKCVSNSGVLTENTVSGLTGTPQKSHAKVEPGFPEVDTPTGHNSLGGGTDLLRLTDVAHDLSMNWTGGDMIPRCGTPSMQDIQCSNAGRGNFRDDIIFDGALYTQILGALTAAPDFTNPREYVVQNDGMTRTSLDAGALMRTRIQFLLQEHIDSAWWRGSEDIVSNQEMNAEKLIALFCVMSDVTDWYALPAESFPSHFTCAFDVEDEILHLGQTAADLWERVNRYLSRQQYSQTGGERRVRAINELLIRMVHSSRMHVSGLS